MIKLFNKIIISLLNLIQNFFLILKYKMGGGLMQLVAMGAQDVYLTGNPQITFLKLSTEDTLTSPKKLLNKNGMVLVQAKACTLARNGDLVQEIYLCQLRLFKDQTEIKHVEVEIGGQKIDKHYGAWLDIYDELFDDNEPLKTAIGGSFMPLRFWFNRNPGLALPLIALQYHMLKLISN